MTDNKDKNVLNSSIEREQNDSICSAECEKIKGSKNLNVPDKRVQNDVCISSAEREEQVTKAQPKGNVPALRFPGFTEEWKKIRLGDNCSIQMCKRIMAAECLFIKSELLEVKLMPTSPKICLMSIKGSILIRIKEK